MSGDAMAGTIAAAARRGGRRADGAASEARGDRAAAGRPRVAFQGELGAYGEAAVAQYWGGHAEPVPVRAFTDVAALVAGGLVDFGVLPLENTVVGPVVPARDALAAARRAERDRRVHVVGETVLPVRHCLLAPRGASLAGLRTVASQAIALEQCGRFLQAHPHLALRTSWDTAAAAREVSEAGDPTAGAIAGRTAAERYGLAILAEGVADVPDNLTRFVVLALEARDGAAR